ncbi:MAG: cytochrome c family protein [Deltaproteobacteria bacterium]|nr:cytochrome c family protein [Deltaproteobacteria bacterium]
MLGAACAAALLLGELCDPGGAFAREGPAARPAARELPAAAGPGAARAPAAPAAPELAPPGAEASPAPSELIFPPQSLPLRFDHALHAGKLGQGCKACHASAYRSGSAADSLLPEPVAACDGCHDVDHRDRRDVRAGAKGSGRCETCHVVRGAGPAGSARVTPVVLRAPNLRMSHRAHLERNIGCEQCHGRIDRLAMATRESLPRMAGCFVCHAMSDAAQGEARGNCAVCHLTRPDGRLRTELASGKLVPPRWLHGAEHTADWTERHRGVAGANSRLCGNCHASAFCTSCHDGRLRPRAVHPGDWLSQHPLRARQDSPRCGSCHQEQRFCGDCHRRTGVARDVGGARRPGGRRFHPAPTAWTSAPRGPGHHSWEAQRNMTACVSCHTERDCATCHATRGLRGGQGVNPHPSGFGSACAPAYRRNPRPCLVCHAQDDTWLGGCR